MMNSLLRKFYDNYTMIYAQHFSKPSYIKHYSIIHIWLEQLTSVYKYMTRYQKSHQ